MGFFSGDKHTLSPKKIEKLNPTKSSDEFLCLSVWGLRFLQTLVRSKNHSKLVFFDIHGDVKRSYGIWVCLRMATLIGKTMINQSIECIHLKSDSDLPASSLRKLPIVTLW